MQENKHYKQGYADGVSNIQEIVEDLGGILYDFDNGYNVFECRDMLQSIEDRLKKIAKGV